MALATPFAIQVSADDSTLVVSAASSNTVFTVDAGSGEILGRVTVGSVPRGIALQSGEHLDAYTKGDVQWLEAEANARKLTSSRSPKERWEGIAGLGVLALYDGRVGTGVEGEHQLPLEAARRGRPDSA